MLEINTRVAGRSGKTQLAERDAPERTTSCTVHKQSNLRGHYSQILETTLTSLFEAVRL
jgi:hypothetical protein